MSIANRVNLDFEEALASNNPELKNDKICSFFDYVYLLCEETSPLYSKTKFTDEYLHSLEKLGLKLPEVTSRGEFTNWWGSLENFSEAKRLNSKVETSKLFKEVSGAIITTEDDLLSALEDGEKYYYRSEFGFSGRSNKVIYPNKEYKLRFPGVLTPYLDVQKSFGITVNLDSNDYFICENFINERGEFLGGKIVEDSEFINRENLLPIFKKLKDVGYEGSVEFDSLIYRLGKKGYWYPVVEVNYRKTMGHVINKLQAKFGTGCWHLRPNKNKLKSKDKYLSELSKELGGNFIITSPLDKPILSVFVIH